MRFFRIFCCFTLLPVLSMASLGCFADDFNKDGKLYVVAFAQDTMANDWRHAQVEQMAQAFAAYSEIKFIYSDGKGDSAKQIQDIENFVYQNVDVLMTSPRDSLAATPIIAKAYKQGIPVVLVSRSISTDDYTSFVAPDNYQIAASAGHYLAKKLKGKGQVLMLSGIPTASPTQARTKGIRDSLREYPDIRIVADKVANYLRADAIRAVEEALAEGVEFNAIYAQSDSMASGARLALKKAGINVRDIIIVGIDYISEAREAIRHGEQTASFVYPTSAVEAVGVVLNILHHKSVAKRVVVESMLVTAENVEAVDPIF